MSVVPCPNCGSEGPHVTTSAGLGCEACGCTWATFQAQGRIECLDLAKPDAFASLRELAATRRPIPGEALGLGPDSGDWMLVSMGSASGHGVAVAEVPATTKTERPMDSDEIAVWGRVYAAALQALMMRCGEDGWVGGPWSIEAAEHADDAIERLRERGSCKLPEEGHQQAPNHEAPFVTGGHGSMGPGPLGGGGSGCIVVSSKPVGGDSVRRCAACHAVAPQAWSDARWDYATQSDGEPALLCPECLEPSEHPDATR